jgi:hypothetical protein
MLLKSRWPPPAWETAAFRTANVTPSAGSVFRLCPAAGMRNATVPGRDERHDRPIVGPDGGGTPRGRWMMVG